MKCEEVKINLPEYIDGKLDEQTTKAVQTHLEACMACSELHRDMKSFLGFTNSLPEIEPPVGMKAEFMQMLEAEMPRKQKQIVMLPVWLKVAAVLVVALITYSSGYYLGSEKGRQQVVQLEAVLGQTRQQVLLASLQEYTGPQKIEAVYAVSQLGQTGDALIDALVTTMNSDKNVNVRLAAINALSGMISKNDRVKQALIQSLPLQENPLLQISLIQVLTESGVKEAKKEIESVAADEKTDENVKAFAKDMMKAII
jgi:hypothetical protein